MLSLAVSSMFFHEYPIDEIFSSVEEAGLVGVEFWVETPHFWLRGQPLYELKAAVRAHPALASLTLHAPALDLNPCSINPRVAAASQQYAVEAVALAGAVGADVVTVHPGRRTARRPPSHYDYEHFETYLERLRQVAEETGVKVAIENMEPKVNSLLCTPEGVHEILDAHPWLWFTLDVAHAMTVSEEEIARYLEICGDRIANVHLSVAAGGRRHLPVAGRPEACEVVRALRGAGYRGPLTLEIEDQVFAHPLSLEEKIMVLREERRYVTWCLS
ncbi:MAG: sugar phosphate isomerase/epimerase [Methanofollis sp.]|nr:sugar phosphate isomerase/epimerase [Methanofollis sp.]